MWEPINASSDSYVVEALAPLVSGAFTIDGDPLTPHVTCSPSMEPVWLTFLQGEMTFAYARISCAGPYRYAVNLPLGTYRVFVQNTGQGVQQPFFGQVELPSVITPNPATLDRLKAGHFGRSRDRVHYFELESLGKEAA